MMVFVSLSAFVSPASVLLSSSSFVLAGAACSAAGCAPEVSEIVGSCLLMTLNEHLCPCLQQETCFEDSGLHDPQTPREWHARHSQEAECWKVPKSCWQRRQSRPIAPAAPGPIVPAIASHCRAHRTSHSTSRALPRRARRSNHSRPHCTSHCRIVAAAMGPLSQPPQGPLQNGPLQLPFQEPTLQGSSPPQPSLPLLFATAVAALAELSTCCRRRQEAAARRLLLLLVAAASCCCFPRRRLRLRRLLVAAAAAASCCCRSSAAAKWSTAAHRVASGLAGSHCSQEGCTPCRRAPRQHTVGRGPPWQTAEPYPAGPGCVESAGSAVFAVCAVCVCV